jgi:hypothetical protein
MDDGLATMGGDLAFTAASEIVNANCNHEEHQACMQAERKKAKNAEYQAYMKTGTWELTPLPKGEGCTTSGRGATKNVLSERSRGGDSVPSTQKRGKKWKEWIEGAIHEVLDG